MRNHSLSKLAMLPGRIMGSLFQEPQPEPNLQLVAFFAGRQSIAIKETTRRSLAALRSFEKELPDLCHSFGIEDDEDMAERLDCAIGSVGKAYAILKAGLPYRFMEDESADADFYNDAHDHIVEVQRILAGLITAIDTRMDSAWLFDRAGHHLRCAISLLDSAWFEQEFGNRLS